MSTGTFRTQVEKICVNIEKGLLGAVKNAIRETVQEAQKPRDDGGKMPVDTGFLRWSGTASLNQAPVGLYKGRLRKKGEEGVLPEYKMNNEGGKMLNTCLVEMKLGDTFHFGWTAKYAYYQEIYCGFMESAVANFKYHFDKELRRLK